MAQGDIKWFSKALLNVGKKLIDLSADTIKVGLITSAATPTLSTADPCWGAGGTTNFSTNQVATGGTAYTGPKTLSSVTWTEISNVPTLRGTLATIAQDALGFANARWAIIYDDTTANKNCIAFVDLGSDRSLVSGPLTIDFSGANDDILTLTQS